MRRRLRRRMTEFHMSLTLYFHPLSSFCQKALIALYENGTPFTPHVVDLMDAKDAADFKTIWPIGKFPVLRDERAGARFRNPASSSNFWTGIIPAHVLHPEGRGAALETRFRDRFFDLYLQHADAEGRNRQAAARGKTDPLRCRAGESAAATTALRIVDEMHGEQYLGHRRRVHDGRLRGGAGAVLRRHGRCRLATPTGSPRPISIG